jgi:hypothetical protein
MREVFVLVLDEAETWHQPGDLRDWYGFYVRFGRHDQRIAARISFNIQPTELSRTHRVTGTFVWLPIWYKFYGLTARKIGKQPRSCEAIGVSQVPRA